MLAHRSPKPAQRTAVRAVTGQVCETSSNGKGSAAAAADDHSMQEQAKETPKQQFNWWVCSRRFAQHNTCASAHAERPRMCLYRFKQWYPIAVLEDLDPRLPMHAQLLGIDLAIWWDANASTWR